MSTLPPSAGPGTNGFDLGAWLASPPLPPIVQTGATVLRTPAQPVPASMFGTEALRRLVHIMVEVMRQAPGVGLAAPQIAVPLRLFVAEDPEDRLAHVAPEARAARRRVMLPLFVVANPVLTVEGDERVTFFEGCLSVRGFGALVPRYRRVRVQGVTPQGEPVDAVFEGWPARIMQHESDHLDGTLYVDRMHTRTFCCEAEMRRLSSSSPDEVMRELGVSRDA